MRRIATICLFYAVMRGLAWTSCVDYELLRLLATADSALPTEIRFLTGFRPVRNDEEVRDLASVDGNVTVRIFRAHVFCPGPDEPVVVELLNHVGSPAADAGDREDGREQVFIDSENVIGRSRVEIDVGV